MAGRIFRCIIVHVELRVLNAKRIVSDHAFYVRLDYAKVPRRPLLFVLVSLFTMI